MSNSQFDETARLEQGISEGGKQVLVVAGKLDPDLKGKKVYVFVVIEQKLNGKPRTIGRGSGEQTPARTARAPKWSVAVNPGRRGFAHGPATGVALLVQPTDVATEPAGFETYTWVGQLTVE